MISRDYFEPSGLAYLRIILPHGGVVGSYT